MSFHLTSPFNQSFIKNVEEKIHYSLSYREFLNLTYAFLWRSASSQIPLIWWLNGINVIYKICCSDASFLLNRYSIKKIMWTLHSLNQSPSTSRNYNVIYVIIFSCYVNQFICRIDIQIYTVMLYAVSNILLSIFESTYVLYKDLSLHSAIKLPSYGI